MKRFNHVKNRLFIVLLVLFIAHLFFRIFSHRDEYLTRYDPKFWEDKYMRSQWVVPNSKEPIGDDGLFAYEGWEYIHGRNPAELNAEVPPLGKYLIGLTTLTFGNQNIFALLSGIFALAVFYFLNLALMKDRFFAFLPVFLFSLEPLFYTQLRATYLDLLYLGFLFMIFLFALKKRYILSAVFLGLMAATKSSLTTFVVVGGTVYLYFLFQDIFAGKVRKLRDVQMKKYLFYLPVSFLAFLLTYLMYFAKGNNLMQFLGVQKWIFNFYNDGAKGELLTPWKLLTTGQWQTWFAGMQRVQEWHIGWAILLLLSIISIIVMIKKRQSDEFVLLGMWLVIYLLFLSVIPVWPRYLLLLLPFMYNLSVWFTTKKLFRIS